jgi:citrate synthase
MNETIEKGETRRADYLSRNEALEILRIKPQTLYCYVSRGYIRSVPQPDGRSSYYSREDVEKVKAKSVARSGHGPAAAAAMRWGEPVIQTSVTELTEDGPRYRNRLAVELARAGTSFETVAEYLWAGEWHEEAHGWRVEDRPGELPALLALLVRLNPRVHIHQLLSATSLTLGTIEGGASERIRSGGTALLSACRLIRSMTGAFGFLGPWRSFVPMTEAEPVAHGLARALGLEPRPEVVRALNAALVLIADHELNPATFAVRIAASTGADLHACIGAALGVHVGSLIGRGCDLVEELFVAGAEAATIHAAARGMVHSAQQLPGFDHPLYPHGDPRTHMLIELAGELGGEKKAVQQMLEALRRIEDELQAQPAIETGLVMLCRSLGAPERAAAGIFALGRCAGWVAHILEQRLQGFMIRPRAQFTRGATSGGR